jgi:hypothetical protein
MSLNHTRRVSALLRDDNLAYVFAGFEAGGPRNLFYVLSGFRVGGPCNGSREIVFRIRFHVAVLKEQF